MRIATVTLLPAVCVAAAAMTVSANASAQQHYYAIMESYVTGNDSYYGDSIEIDTEVLHSTCNILTKNFVDHELWYGTDLGWAHWVEVGFKDGRADSGGCVTDVDFWADQNEYGYYEHYPNNGWNFTTWYTASITSAGSCSWNVTLGGLNLGTSTSNCPGSGRAMESGIETTSQTTGSASGYITQWEELSYGSTWYSPWDGWYTYEDDQPLISWVNDNADTWETLNE